MKILDPVLARVRYIMEEFIHHVTPVNLLISKEPASIVNDIRRQAVTDDDNRRDVIVSYQ